MCFLKTFKQLDSIHVEKNPQGAEVAPPQLSQGHQDNSPFQNIKIESDLPAPSSQQHILFNLLSLVTANSQSLTSLDQKLNNTQLHLNCFFQQLEAPHSPLCEEVVGTQASSCARMESEEGQMETETEEPRTKADCLVEQLFGKKKYDYKLRLTGAPPETIYKERNINIGVELVTMENEKVLNSNILHLCLAVVDANGEWVTQNKVKENFMKGKTEVELYHGEGTFLKVYPREVSRSYPSGKLNFLIYAKPSVLRFSSNNSLLEREVESSLIQPLLLEDISIKAKKKQ